MAPALSLRGQGSSCVAGWSPRIPVGGMLSACVLGVSTSPRLPVTLGDLVGLRTQVTSGSWSDLDQISTRDRLCLWLSLPGLGWQDVMGPAYQCAWVTVTEPLGLDGETCTAEAGRASPPMHPPTPHALREKAHSCVLCVSTAPWRADCPRGPGLIPEGAGSGRGTPAVSRNNSRWHTSHGCVRGALRLMVSGTHRSTASGRSPALHRPPGKAPSPGVIQGE